MSDAALQSVDYQRTRTQCRSLRLAQFGAACAIVADLALLLSIFIRNGGRYWGPYLYPPVTMYWAKPIFFGSLLLGTIAIFTAGLGVLRPAGGLWKIIALVGALAYWAGFGCVVAYGLM